MSEKKSVYSAEEFLEKNNPSGIFNLDIIIMMMEGYASQSRTTLTLEEEQAMDQIVFPVKTEGKYIITDASKRFVLDLYSSDHKGRDSQCLANLITRLLNAEQERRRR